MKRSEDRILTTHVGSLPEPAGLDPRSPEYDDQLKRAVVEIVQRQADTGLDIVNDGELGKGHWLAYLNSRIGGCEERSALPGPSLLAQGLDRDEFPGFYEEATQRGTLFYSSGYQHTSPSSRGTRFVCTSALTYTGQQELERDIRNFQATAAVTVTDRFMTATAPASIEPYRHNEFYPTEKAFLDALAATMRVEYEAIARTGVILQIDDAWTAALWDRIGVKIGLKAYKKRCMARVEALNQALAGVPEEQIRYHVCWGSWHGPHAHDISMTDLADVVLSVKAGAYLFEAGNVRHEHEYHVWEQAKLPKGKILIPGVISHATNLVEHPDLIAERIQRFARLVGRQNVIAGTDCGFGGRVHAEIAWAKLGALVEGARRASKALFGR